MLLHNIFHTAIHVFQLIAATILIASSGAEVQKATTVSQIIKSEILNFFATEEDQSIK